MLLKTWTPNRKISNFYTTVSDKIDGISVEIGSDKIPISRKGNIIKNLIPMSLVLDPGIYEFFRTDWGTSLSLAMNQKHLKEIRHSDFYMLRPHMDLRLNPRPLLDRSASWVQEELKRVCARGMEGLVICDKNYVAGWKVKPKITIDLRVIGVIEGHKERNKGILASALVQNGDSVARVSSGFTTEQRIEFFNDPTFVGSIIEIEFTSFTESKGLRHARFIRRRIDKDTENLEF
jgi:hypothetical protein